MDPLRLRKRSHGNVDKFSLLEASVLSAALINAVVAIREIEIPSSSLSLLNPVVVDNAKSHQSSFSFLSSFNPTKQSPFRLQLLDPAIDELLRSFEAPEGEGDTELSEQNSKSGSVAPLPFVVLHGIGDACSNPGMSKFLKLLSKLSGGANGTCIEIGDGFRDSWLMRLDKQTSNACNQVCGLDHLKKGFNILGLSQGGLIGRAIVQSCDCAPKARNLVSIGGPQAGVASTPNCVYSSVCRLIDIILQLGIYSEIAQNNVAPAGYVKIPTMLDVYLKHAKFLPFVNNETPGKRNGTFVTRFKALNRVALIKFDEDTVLFPKETAHFEFFAPNTFENPVPLKDSSLYLEDWIGLRELDVQGKVDFLTFPGNHLHLPLDLIQNSIVPYLDGSM